MGVAICLKLRCNSIFAGGLLDAKLVDAVFGVVGDFRFGIDEQLARLNFRFLLRGRDCRLARDVVIFSAGFLLRLEKTCEMSLPRE